MPKILNNPIIISGGGSGGNLSKAIQGSLNSENYSLTAGDMSGVTKIGDYKFYQDSKLTAIDLSSVTEIGVRSFYNTQNLESIDLSNVDKIGNEAFALSHITSATLKNANIEMGTYAFGACSSLSTFTIPDLIQTIPAQFLSGCANITSLTIGKGVTKIGNDAFRSLEKVSDLYFNAENLPYVGNNKSSSNYIFYDLGKNVANGTHLHIGDDVTILPYNFLAATGAKISKVKQITWGTQNKLTKICGRAFYLVPYASAMLLPEGLLEIEDYAFYWCSSATSIEIPSTITKIGNNAFEYMAAMTYAKIKATTPPIFGTNVFANCAALISIRVPAASLISYLGVANLSTYASKIIGYQNVGLNNNYPDYSDGVNYTQTRWYANVADAVADTTGTGGTPSGNICHLDGEVYCKVFA